MVELKLPKYSLIPEEPVVVISLQQIDPVIDSEEMYISMVIPHI